MKSKILKKGTILKKVSNSFFGGKQLNKNLLSSKTRVEKWLQTLVLNSNGKVYPTEYTKVHKHGVRK